MTPFDCYKTYLAFKNHFTKDAYDYHKYCGKSRATLDSFYKRRDRYFFEKTSRQRSDKEVEDFFIANFALCNDPQSLWIGEIIKNGNKNYLEWQKKIQGLKYLFKQETENLLSEQTLDTVFDCSKGHPVLLKKFLTDKISLETLVIYDRIFLYSKDFDKKLLDPVWQTVSMRIKKYTPFINIDVFEYKRIVKEIVFGNV
jgi:hypothetical protein